jgi:hypothetical protein
VDFDFDTYECVLATIELGLPWKSIDRVIESDASP